MSRLKYYNINLYCLVILQTVENHKMVTCDVTGAFLEALMPEDYEVLMSLDAMCAKLLFELDVAWKVKEVFIKIRENRQIDFKKKYDC